MRVFVVCLLLVFSGSVQGQNLVPNPSFEIYSQCPDDQDQFNYASAWFKPTANSTDYYNACSTIPQFNFSVDVPQNFLGHQPARSGDGYGGASFFSATNTREYMSTALFDTLIAGRKYCVEFWVAVADSSLDGIASIGMYFSNTMINDQSTIEYLPLQPQIVSDPNTPITDTVNWTKISGVYTAQGGERFIIIGNFQPDSLVVLDTIRPHSSNYGTYCYVDDVSVIEIADCVAGNDIAICYRDSIQLGTVPKVGVMYTWFPAYGLSDPNISNPLASPDTTIIYTLTQTECDFVSTCAITVTVDRGCHHAPTILIPSLLYADQNLFIYGLESNSKLELFDDRGRLIFYESDYQNGFWSTNLAAGMYVARLTRPNGEQIGQKICVIR